MCTNIPMVAVFRDQGFYLYHSIELFKKDSKNSWKHIQDTLLHSHPQVCQLKNAFKVVLKCSDARGGSVVAVKACAVDNESLERSWNSSIQLPHLILICLEKHVLFV